MKLETRTIALDGGEAVSSVWAYESRSEAARTGAVILAHGAGAGMNHEFMKFFHEGLARRGFLAVRFNFLYKEKGRKAPDPAPRLESTFRSVAAAVRQEAGSARLFVGGKSMVGRIASHLAAQGEPLDGLFLLGYPLHPPNRPERLRSQHLGEIRCRTLFLQGSRDALCRLDLLQEACRQFQAPCRLHVIEEGDHSFKVPKSSGRSDGEARQQALDVLADWLSQGG